MFVYIVAAAGDAIVVEDLQQTAQQPAGSCCALAALGFSRLPCA